VSVVAIQVRHFNSVEESITPPQVLGVGIEGKGVWPEETGGYQLLKARSIHAHASDEG